MRLTRLRKASATRPAFARRARFGQERVRSLTQAEAGQPLTELRKVHWKRASGPSHRILG